MRPDGKWGWLIHHSTFLMTRPIDPVTLHASPRSYDSHSTDRRSNTVVGSKMGSFLGVVRGEEKDVAWRARARADVFRTPSVATRMKNRSSVNSGHVFSLVSAHHHHFSWRPRSSSEPPHRHRDIYFRCVPKNPTVVVEFSSDSCERFFPFLPNS